MCTPYPASDTLLLFLVLVLFFFLYLLAPLPLYFTSSSPDPDPRTRFDAFTPRFYAPHDSPIDDITTTNHTSHLASRFSHCTTLFILDTYAYAYIDVVSSSLSPSCT